MKLGLQLGHWGATAPTGDAELVAAAGGAGFDTVFTPEAWGSDAYTPLAWWGRQTTQVIVTDDRATVLEVIRPYLALYTGGMGSEDTNFYANLFRRMGYRDVVDDVTTLFRRGRKDEAAKTIPGELVDDAAIVGDEGYVRRKLDRWAASGVTMILIRGNNAQHIRDLAHLATPRGPELEKAERQ